MNPAAAETAFAQNRADRSASYDALTAIEDALGAPVPGREAAWLDTVIEALDVLIAALGEQARHNREPGSLLSQIAIDHPRLSVRIIELEDELDQLHAAEQTLRDQITEDGTLSSSDLLEVRTRLADLDTQYRLHRALETDLIYEATTVDIGGKG
ncbi:MAG: hypothetical protein DWP92_01355 [Armatimonadetes bacterium]|nr:MAG: hypothetical protein DWP92_01355 [Armatimonadota bacterium]